MEAVYDPLLDDFRLKDTEDVGMAYDPYLEEFRMKDTETGNSYDAFLEDVRQTVDPTVAAVISGLVLSNITEETVDYSANVVCNINTVITIEHSLNADMTEAVSIAYGQVSVNTVISGQLTGLTPGSTIYVRVKAVNAGGQSFSNVANGGLLNVLGIVSESDAMPFNLDITAGGGTNYTWRKKVNIHPCTDPQLIHVNMGRVVVTAPGIGRAEGIDPLDVAIDVQASLERNAGTIHQSGVETVQPGIKIFPKFEGVTIAEKEQCWLRSYANINAVSKFRKSAAGCYGGTDNGWPVLSGAEGRGANNLTGAGSCPTYYEHNQLPTVFGVIGKVTQKSAVFIIGDSTATIPVLGAIWDDLGAWWQKAFHNRKPYTCCGCGQDTLNNIAQVAYSQYRMSFAKYCKTAIVMAGVNDLNNNRTVAQMIADYKTICTRLKAEGITTVYVTTVTPVTTSTDSWITLANQTVFAKHSVRQDLNAALRAGELNGFATIIDVAAVTEEGVTGKWKVDETIYMANTVPTSKTGHKFTFAGQAWVANSMKGKMLYSVTGNKIALITSNTSEVMNTAPNTIAVTETCRIINPLTIDGTHFSIYGGNLIGAAVATAYGY